MIGLSGLFSKAALGEAFKNIDRPSNALQGLFVDGTEGLKRGWNQEEDYDFEQMHDRELAKKGYYERDNLDRLKYVGFGAANLLADPLNVVGLGLFSKGTKAVKTAKAMGANVDKNAMKGSLISSFPNYIQEYYTPTAKTLEKMKAYGDDTLWGVKKADAYGAFKKGLGFAKTAKSGFSNMIWNTLSPEARALYRSHGINKNMLESAFLSNKSNKEIEVIHRAIYNAHIVQQAGKTGDSKLLDTFMGRVQYKGYTPYKEGDYHKASKLRVKGGSGISKDEANMLESIMGGVWTNRKGIRASDDPNTLVLIKRPSGTKGGSHINDMKTKSPDITKIANLFDKNSVQLSNYNLDELAEYLTKVTGKAFTPDKTTGQVWSNFSMKGTSITEGGVNIAFGIKPNGKFIAAVSDEHNFLEKIPVVGTMIESSLSKRVITMTTPVTGKIKNFKRAEGSGAKPTLFEKNRIAMDKKLDNKRWDEHLAQLIDAKATRSDALLETGRQYQTLGAGVFSGSSSQ
jgi:hypothetical protein